MTDVTLPPTRVGPVASSYVDWGAVIAGAVIASAVSFVLITAGAAIGLSFASPYPTQSFGAAGAFITVFWVLFASILSFLVGGYTAGRMRSSWEAAETESEFRDGVHGALVWGVSILIGGLLALLAAATAAQTGPAVSQTALRGPAAIVAPAVDSLLHGTTDTHLAATEPAVPKPGAAAPAAPPAQSAAQVPSADLRADVARTLAAAVAAGELTPADRHYLAQLVAQRTGQSSTETEAQVDAAFAQAKRDLEKARKATVLTGLVTATALLIGLVAAWYAAQNGGHHRDHNIPARFDFARRGFLQRRTPPPA